MQGSLAKAQYRALPDKTWEMKSVTVTDVNLSFCRKYMKRNPFPRSL